MSESYMGRVMSRHTPGYAQAQTFWEMHPNFQRFSPKLKVTTFLSRPAKLNYKSNDFFTSASQAGWLGNCRSLQNIAFTEPAFPSLGFSSQPSLDGWRFIWGHRQITIWGNAFPDCTFSTLILVLPHGPFRYICKQELTVHD